MDYEELEGEKGRGTLVKASQAGQLAWKDIIRRLKEFEYEHEGVAIRWHVAGTSSPIIIDPRISFGAPTVGGTPTWIIKGRCVLVRGRAIADALTLYFDRCFGNRFPEALRKAKLIYRVSHNCGLEQVCIP
jgi:hypothetical protein